MKKKTVFRTLRVKEPLHISGPADVEIVSHRKGRVLMRFLIDRNDEVSSIVKPTGIDGTVGDRID